MVPQILETPMLLLSPSRPLIQNPTLTHHCMMAHAPCSSEQFAVNEVAYYNGAVCGTLAGPEKSLGLFWQARLLAYNVVVSSLGKSPQKGWLCRCQRSSTWTCWVESLSTPQHSAWLLACKGLGW